MKKPTLMATTFILLLLIVPIESDSVSAGPAADVAGLEAFLDGFIGGQMTEHDIVGVTLAVVQDGEILLLKGYGYAERESKTPVDPAIRFCRSGLA